MSKRFKSDLFNDLKDSLGNAIEGRTTSHRILNVVHLCGKELNSSFALLDINKIDCLDCLRAIINEWKKLCIVKGIELVETQEKLEKLSESDSISNKKR